MRLPAAHGVREAFDRLGLAEQIALQLLAVFADQEAHLAGGLDPLCHDADAQAASQPQHGAHDHRGLRAGFDLPDEGPVDLDLVEGEGLQGRERGVARSEIVHRDADAQRL